MPTDLSSAVGRTSQDEAELTTGPANRLAAALDFGDAPFCVGDRLPPAWHWLYFLSAPKASAVGSDGRGASGQLVPAFEGLNRMWAGGGFVFNQALKFGDRVQRRSKVMTMDEKDGRSGRLVLASVEHRVSSAQGPAVTERHDLVFRERRPGPAQLGAGVRSAKEPNWQRSVTPDEVLLFRFSALTYNSHRIHYDWPYATATEGYPGLLVHGPLTAVLLLDLIGRNAPERELGTFQYRAMRPLFCGQPITLRGCAAVNGRSVDVWAEDHDGFVAMRGQGDWR